MYPSASRSISVEITEQHTWTIRQTTSLIHDPVDVRRWRRVLDLASRLVSIAVAAARRWLS